MTLPTEAQDPNGNAMYKPLLYRPSHRLPEANETGETPDPFACLHTAESDGDETASNPCCTSKGQRDRYRKDMDRYGKIARETFQRRL